MARCAVCGKRIWSELVSIPGKGDYHYNCADETGVLLTLEISRESIRKKAAEILKEITPLLEQAKECRDAERTQALNSRLEKEVSLLKMQEMILTRRELKAAREKKGV